MCGQVFVAVLLLVFFSLMKSIGLEDFICCLFSAKKKKKKKKKKAT